MPVEGSSAERHSLELGPSVDQEQIRVSYLRRGAGRPTLLLHGFASNAEEDWIDTGWFNELANTGHDVVAPDLRGHGCSFKSHNAADYALASFTTDMLALCDACWGKESFFLVGYSMGAHIAMSLALSVPARVSSLVIGGMGERIAATVGLAPEFADALDLEKEQVEHTVIPQYAIRFRQHAASRPWNDLRALAACLRGQSGVFDLAALSVVEARTLVLVGEQDKLAGPPYRVASLFPQGIGGTVPGVTHASALADPTFRSRATTHLESTATTNIED